MKITRRKLAAALASPALLVTNPSAATAQTAAPADPLEAAKARIKANSDALAKQDVPMSTEPAFQFKA
jgi:hypothetical protein